MAKNSGKIVMGLQHHQLHVQFSENLIDYYKSIIKDRNTEVKMHAVHNLPCFYSNFRNLNDDTKDYFDNIYIELCLDQN